MEQINSRGQALEEGLDVFISTPFLSDEYLSFNDSFITSTLSAANIVTSNSGYAISAVSSAGLPAYSNSNWYRFSSNAEAFAFSWSISVRIIDRIVSLSFDSVNCFMVLILFVS